jgi:Xaa-Pro aminopeptidase
VAKLISFDKVMYYQTDFPPEEFQNRRRTIADRIGASAVAVIGGAGATGAFDYFRQTNELYYLSGVEVPHAYLQIDGETNRSTLYLPHHDPKHERSEGPQLHCDVPNEVAILTGIERVAPLAQLAADVKHAGTIFTPQSPGEGRQAWRDTLRYQRKLAEADPWDQRPSRESHLQSRLAAVAPQATFRDLSPLLDELRLIKSVRELSLLRRAGQLTAEAVRKAMQQTRVGLYEYQLAAVADHVFSDAAARSAGYRAIVAGGANIWNAHYYRNDCPLRDGDLVLMDYAPDIGCYTSDIGRMWPVNGRYSALQRELYGFVVAYHETLIDLIRPGATVAELARDAADRIRPRWQAWPFSKDVYREAARTMIESEVAFTHPVGMAVHDVGEYRQAPLRPDIVFALDPQMWVPDESLYIRVEDTVAVTRSGVEVLTAGAPRGLDEVEQLMKSKTR